MGGAKGDIGGTISPHAKTPLEERIEHPAFVPGEKWKQR